MSKITRLVNNCISEMIATGNYKPVYNKYIGIVKDYSRARVITSDEAIETERKLWRVYCKVVENL